MDLLSVIGATISNASSLVELIKKLNNQELYNIIAELNLQLANVQNGSAELIRENNTLKSELENIKNDKANPLKYNPDDGLYYDSETKNPYCPNCYEGKKERRHLRVDYKRCPNCKEIYQEKSFGTAVANRVGWDPHDY